MRETAFQMSYHDFYIISYSERIIYKHISWINLLPVSIYLSIPVSSFSPSPFLALTPLISHFIQSFLASSS